MSVTYAHEQHLVTQTFMATADVRGLCGEFKQARAVSIKTSLQCKSEEVLMCLG